MNKIVICSPFVVPRPVDTLKTAETIREAVKAKLVELGICGTDHKYDHWYTRFQAGTVINDRACKGGENAIRSWVEVRGKTYGFEYGFAAGDIVIDLYLIGPD